MEAAEWGVAFGEWAERLWIVQEQMLNPHGVMLRGPRLLAWDAVVAIPLLFDIELLPQAHVYPFCPRSPWDISQSLYFIWHRRTKLAEDPTVPKVSLLANLDRFDYLHCRDPRDRIYALLAVSRSELGIAPDYSKSNSTHRHYHQVSLRVLRDSSNFEALVIACRWYDSTGWVSPSWTLKPPPPPTLIAQFTSFAEHAPHPHFSRLPLPRFRSNDSVLVLRGRRIDAVATSAHATYFPDPAIAGTHDVNYVQRYSLLISSWSSILCHQGVSLNSVASLCRAITCRPTWPSNHETVYCFVCYFRLRVDSLKVAAAKLAIDISTILGQCNSVVEELDVLATETVVGDSASYPSQGSSLNPRSAEKRAIDKIMSHGFVRGRSFCVTTEGRVCNAMHGVEAGDAIIALAGSKSLFVLRPFGDKYRLAGDAFVDGLMLGEAYHGLDPNKVDYDIELV